MRVFTVIEESGGFMYFKLQSGNKFQSLYIAGVILC